MLKRAAREAGRKAFDLTHLLVEVLAGLLVIALLLAAVLAVRLSEGPLRIDTFTRPFIASFNRQNATHIRAAHILLAWRGWRTSDSPVQLQVEQLEITNAQNNTETTLAVLPEASVSLSLSRLLIGELRPIGITFDDAALKVTRAADGSVALDLGDLIKPGPNATPFAALAALGLLGEKVPHGALAQLRALRIHNIHVSITDQKLAANWSIDQANLDFLRDANVWHGETSLPLTIGATKLTIAGTAVIAADGTSQLSFSTTTMMPSDLAKDTPGLAFFAALQAPLSLGLSADLTKDFALKDWNLAADLGAGDIATSQGTLKIAQGHLAVSGIPNQTRFDSLTVDLPVRDGAATTHLTGSGDLISDPSGVTGNFTLKLDQVGFADLPELWPTGVIPKTRSWVTNNIAAGVARDLHVEFALVGQPGFTGVQLSSLTGGFTGNGITLAWIKEVPPITNADLDFKLLDRDHIMIAIKGGQQQTGTASSLTITGGTFGMSALALGRPIGVLSVDATGQLPDLLHLLAVPRLRLLSRTPLPFTDTSGAITAHLDLSLPLIAIVPPNEMTIGGKLHGTNVHLGHAAAGHDLDHGTVDVTVNNDGLTAQGHGDFAQMPADITYHTGFRPGAAGDVMQHLSAKGTATPAQLAAAGYDPLHFFDQGQVALTIDYSQTHDRNATLAVTADLTNASLTPQFGWKKDIGTTGQATGVLKLAGSQIIDVPNFSASAPQMSVQGQMTVKNSAITAVLLHNLKLNQSNLTAEIDFPIAPGDPYRATLHGPVIDLSGAFKHNENDPDEDHGPHYTVDANFDRAQMAHGESMNHLAGHFESNLGVMRSAAIIFGRPAQATFNITPTGTSRSLHINATDAGAFLRGTDTLTDLRGGVLSLQGTYDDSKPHHPLSGTANIDNFKISDAPAITKLLQAMTGYGLFAAAQGGGLAITSLKTSFLFQQNILTLENAQAHSASIGFTAGGTVNIASTQTDIRGTIVPAYILNNALSNVPLVGRLFASETGGGAVAANFHVTGPHDNPKVSVNFLSVLTPGFLRGLFSGGK